MKTYLSNIIHIPSIKRPLSDAQKNSEGYESGQLAIRRITSSKARRARYTQGLTATRRRLKSPRLRRFIFCVRGIAGPVTRRPFDQQAIKTRKPGGLLKAPGFLDWAALLPRLLTLGGYLCGLTV